MEEKPKLKRSVKTLREAGLEAQWMKTARGQPVLCARNPNSTREHQRQKWWHIDAGTWTLMDEVGVLEGFDQATMLGDFFSIPL